MPAASASGVADVAKAAPSTPCATYCRATYNSVTPIIATKIARGTVRDGLCTSPLGTSAVSIPVKAKISTMLARSTSPDAGTVVIARFSPCMENTPTTISRSSGASLATVVI